MSRARSSADTKDAQILGFTASRGRGDVEGALVAGCDAFLEKPCTPVQLVRFALGLLGLPLPEDRDGAVSSELVPVKKQA
jgi:CheY-like chemotaxis protein